MVIYDYYVASLKPEHTASAPLSGHVFILADTFVGKPVSDLCAYHDSHTLGESPVDGKFSLCVSQSITGESSKWTETTEVNFTIWCSVDSCIHIKPGKVVCRLAFCFKTTHE